MFAPIASAHRETGPVSGRRCDRRDQLLRLGTREQHSHRQCAHTEAVTGRRGALGEQFGAAEQDSSGQSQQHQPHRHAAGA